eukprot:6455966-Amphidinium_carterae.1
MAGIIGFPYPLEVTADGYDALLAPSLYHRYEPHSLEELASRTNMLCGAVAASAPLSPVQPIFSSPLPHRHHRQYAHSPAFNVRAYPAASIDSSMAD